MINSTFTFLADYSSGLLLNQAPLTGILTLACCLLLNLAYARRRKTRTIALTAGANRPSAIADLWFRIVLVFAMALPMLVLYATSTLGVLLSQDLHFKPEWLGYLIMSSFGLAAILSLWAGALVDRLGSRYSLMMLFSAIALAFALMVAVQNFYGLIAAVGVCGIAQALANPVTNLLIAQQVPPEKKAMVVGLKQAGVQLAALFAGLVLPGIAVAFGWRFALASIIPLALLFILTTPFVTPKMHTRSGKGFALSLPNPLLFRLMSIQFCVGISLSAFVTFLPTFATQQGMPLSLAGTLIAVFGAMGIISRMVLTPMGAKLKDESLLLLALIAIAAVAMAVTMQASPGQYWPLWVGAVGVGLTAVGTNAIAMSMLIRDPAFGVVTSASGFVSVAFFGGFALGPPLYGVLSDYSGGLLLSWSTLIGVLGVGCIMALALASARRRKLQARIANVDEIAQLKSEILLLNERIGVLESNYVGVLIKLTELSNSHQFNNETMSSENNGLALEPIGNQVSNLRADNQILRKTERKKQRKKPQIYRVN